MIPKKTPWRPGNTFLLALEIRLVILRFREVGGENVGLFGRNLPGQFRLTSLNSTAGVRKRGQQPRADYSPPF